MQNSWIVRVCEWWIRDIYHIKKIFYKWWKITHTWCGHMQTEIICLVSSFVKSNYIIFTACCCVSFHSFRLRVRKRNWPYSFFIVAINSLRFHGVYKKNELHFIGWNNKFVQVEGMHWIPSMWYGKDLSYVCLCTNLIIYMLWSVEGLFFLFHFSVVLGDIVHLCRFQSMKPFHCKYCPHFFILQQTNICTIHTTDSWGKQTWQFIQSFLHYFSVSPF